MNKRKLLKSNMDEIRQFPTIAPFILKLLFFIIIIKTKKEKFTPKAMGSIDWIIFPQIHFPYPHSQIKWKYFESPKENSSP